MVVCGPTQLKEVYQEILSRVAKTNGIVVIYTCYDLDSICAAKILTRLLVIDNVRYKLIPVTGYPDLEQRLQELEGRAAMEGGDPLSQSGKEPVKAIIFLNCGARIDLTSQWFQAGDSGILGVLMDSHRPIQHRNVHAGEGIVIVEDPDHFKDCPTEEDVMAAHLADNEDDEELGEAIFGEDENNPEDDKENRQNGASMTGQVDENEEDEDNIQVLLGKKRALKLVNQKKLRMLERKQKESKVQKYYSGSYFSESIAGLAFSLSKQLNQDSDKFLWLWILGLTEMFVNKKVEMKTYSKAYRQCLAEKDRYKVRVSALDDIEKRDEAGGEVKLNSTRIGKGNIAESKELNVFLLRSWTLYDSCYFSNYLLAKLKTWTDDGVRDLEKLLVQVGIPLSEAKQKYTYMGVKHKSDLVRKFTDVAFNKELKYSMPEIQVDSFIKQIDNSMQFSAIDIVHCANSILEYPSSFSAELHKENGFKSMETKSGQEAAIDKILSREDNFWAVYHDVLNEDTEYIQKAIEVAIAYQTSIVREAKRIIDGKQVRSCSDFRYCIISTQYFEGKFMANYLSLQKIASMLIEIYAEVGKPKPLAICMFDQTAQSYTVVGVMPFHSTLSNSKNLLGNKFSLAAANSKVRYSRDYFDGAVIQIEQEDFQAFLQELLTLK